MGRNNTIRLHKLNYTNLAFIICFCGVFFAETVFRKKIYGDLSISLLSPITYLGIFFIWIKCIDNQNYGLGSRLERSLTYLLYILLISFFLYMCIRRHETVRQLGQLLTIILPAVITCFTFKDKKTFETALFFYIRFLKIAVIVMVFCGIIDLLTDFYISSYIANSVNSAALIKQAGFKRCVSYLGHPLFSAEIFLSYYLLTSIESEYENKKRKNSPFILALLGISLTQSKIASVVLLICFVTFNLKNKRTRYIGLGLLIISIGYALGLFDSLIDRFIVGIKAGDMTSARNTILLRLLETQQLRFYYFDMQYISDANSRLKIHVALEYPILRWAFKMGIVCSVLLAIIVFIIPIIKSLKSKNKVIIVSVIAIIIDVSTYSGLGDVGNKPTYYYIIIMMMINAGYYIAKTRGHS